MKHLEIFLLENLERTAAIVMCVIMAVSSIILIGVAAWNWQSWLIAVVLVAMIYASATLLAFGAGAFDEHMERAEEKADELRKAL